MRRTCSECCGRNEPNCLSRVPQQRAIHSGKRPGPSARMADPDGMASRSSTTRGKRRVQLSMAVRAISSGVERSHVHPWSWPGMQQPPGLQQPCGGGSGPSSRGTPAIAARQLSEREEFFLKRGHALGGDSACIGDGLVVPNRRAAWCSRDR
jgi:hypothetical protein